MLKRDSDAIFYPYPWCGPIFCLDDHGTIANGDCTKMPVIAALLTRMSSTSLDYSSLWETAV